MGVDLIDENARRCNGPLMLSHFCRRGRKKCILSVLPKLYIGSYLLKNAAVKPCRSCRRSQNAEGKFFAAKKVLLLIVENWIQSMYASITLPMDPPVMPVGAKDGKNKMLDPCL